MSLLSERAMLASVKISKWSGRKLDREITDEVNAAHGAADDAGRFNKLLVPKESLRKIEKAENAARSFHDKHTAPWADDGARILSAVGYLDYMNGMRPLREAFESAVAEFLAEYPAAKEAAKIRLNGMFRESDYPAPDDLARRFGFSVIIMPVPAGNDFRVDLSDTQADMIRADIEARVAEATANAMRHAFERVAETVGYMAKRLTAYKPASGDKRAEGVFRDSLVENVRELAGLLPALNLTNDTGLAEIAERISAALTLHDADALRESDVLRRAVADDAARIAADAESLMSAYYA